MTGHRLLLAAVLAVIAAQTVWMFGRLDGTGDRLDRIEAGLSRIDAGAARIERRLQLMNETQPSMRGKPE